MKSPFSLLLIGVIAASAIIVTNVQMSEATIRNLAFVHLSKFILQPTLALNESLARSHRLFAMLVTNYHDAGYIPYILRLNGWTTALGDSPIVDKPTTGDTAITDNSNVVDQFIQIIANGTMEMRDETAPKLLALLNNALESDRSYFASGDLKFIPTSLSGVTNRCERLDLISAYIGEEQIATRETVPVVLLWRITSPDTRSDVALDSTDEGPGWELWRDGQLLLQRGLVHNQIPDGGFEQTVLPFVGIPTSLPQRLFARQTQQHSQLVYESPQTAQNVVLVLDGHGDTATGLGSLPVAISVSGNQAYLVTGRYRTDGTADPRVGLRWLLKDKEEWNDNMSSYVVHTPSEQWAPFAGILPPRPDASSYQYWVLNADGNSQLYVDNLGVFSIALPCEVQ